LLGLSFWLFLWWLFVGREGVATTLQRRQRRQKKLSVDLIYLDPSFNSNGFARAPSSIIAMTSRHAV
jgi:16S rRNA G966 N2-methylase RsmD